MSFLLLQTDTISEYIMNNDNLVSTFFVEFEVDSRNGEVFLDDVTVEASGLNEAFELAEAYAYEIYDVEVFNIVRSY